MNNENVYNKVQSKINSELTISQLDLIDEMLFSNRSLKDIIKAVKAVA